MSFITKKFKDKEYTLVEELTEFEQDIIYHFMGDEDEVFCLLENGKYILIEDNEKIEQIKDNLYGEIDGILFNEKFDFKIVAKKIFEICQGSTEIDREQKAKFLLEQVGKLEELEEFNEKKVAKRFSRVRIFIHNRKMPFRTRAFYNINNDAMYFEEGDITGDNIDNKRTRLHETIHAIIGPIKSKLINTIVGRGLKEGATESLVESLYGDSEKNFSIFSYKKFNLSDDCAYKSLVSVIRQIEFLTGKSSTDFALNGNIQIFKDFSQKYGKDLFRYIKCKTKRLANLKLKEKDVDRIFIKLQETILTEVFNKEFESVTDLETAEQYMLRLSQFEGTRALYRGDESFVKYYHEKMTRIIKMLDRQGTSKEEIESFKQKHKYKGWIASLNESPEVALKRRQWELIDCLELLIYDYYDDYFDSKNIAETLGQIQMYTNVLYGKRINTIVFNGKILGEVSIENNGRIRTEKYTVSNNVLENKLGKKVEEAEEEEIKRAYIAIEQSAIKARQEKDLLTELDEQEVQKNTKFVERYIKQRKRVKGIVIKQRTSKIQGIVDFMRARLSRITETVKLKLEELEDGRFGK